MLLHGCNGVHCMSTHVFHQTPPHLLATVNCKTKRMRLIFKKCNNGIHTGQSLEDLRPNHTIVPSAAVAPHSSQALR